MTLVRDSSAPKFSAAPYLDEDESANLALLFDPPRVVEERRTEPARAPRFASDRKPRRNMAPNKAIESAGVFRALTNLLWRGDQKKSVSRT